MGFSLVEDSHKSAVISPTAQGFVFARYFTIIHRFGQVRCNQDGFGIQFGYNRLKVVQHQYIGIEVDNFVRLMPGKYTFNKVGFQGAGQFFNIIFEMKKIWDGQIV